LVGKRQKYGEYKSKLSNDAKKRESILTTARENERRVRETKQIRMNECAKISWKGKHLSSDSSCSLVDTSPSNDTDDRNVSPSIDVHSADLMQLSEHDLFHKLPRFVEEKTNMLLEHSREVQEQTHALKRKQQAIHAFIASMNNNAILQ